MQYAAGIDLGTTFVSAAVRTDGGTRVAPLSPDVVVPSVVYHAPDGTLLTGAAAGSAATDPARIGRGFKRRIGDPTPLLLGGAAYSPTALMAAQLRDVLAAITRAMGSAPESVLLTYPAIWGPYRREQFADVPRQAGLSDVHVMSEPEAAATHYSRERALGDGEIVAVYDLGGGTLDTTVLRVRSGGTEILGTPEGSEHIGGMDFDDALLLHLDERLGGEITRLDPADPVTGTTLAAIRDLCVRTKITLSSADDTTITVPLPSGPRQLTVTRGEFEELIRPSVQQTLVSLRRTLASAGVSGDELSAILLAGGSARIPLVGRMVSEEFGKPVRASQHPKFTVALGAATAATTSPAAAPADPANSPVPTGPVPAGAAPSGAAPNGSGGYPAATPPGGHDDGSSPAAPRRRRRWPLVAGAVAAVAAIGVATTMLLLPSGDEPAAGGEPATSAAGDQPAPQEPVLVFGTGPVDPYKTLIASDANWEGIVVAADDGAALGGTSANFDGGALNVDIQDNTPGQVYLQTVSQSRDLSSYVENEGALVFDMTLHRAPGGATTLGAHCEYPCAGMIDVTEAMNNLPLEQEQQVAVPLKCLADEGLRGGRVDTPFLLNADNGFAATFHSIRWDPSSSGGEGGNAAVLPCTPIP